MRPLQWRGRAGFTPASECLHSRTIVLPAHDRARGTVAQECRRRGVAYGLPVTERTASLVHQGHSACPLSQLPPRGCTAAELVAGEGSQSMTAPSGGAGRGNAGAQNAGYRSEPESSSREEFNQGTPEGAREQIREVKDRVVDQAKNTLREARDRTTSGLSQSRLRAADQVGGIATAIQRTGQHLREEDQARIAGLAESVGRQVEQVASYLRDSDLRAMARDLERIVRQQPVLALGAACALGLAAARFLKSSEPDGDADQYGYDRIGAGGEPAGVGGGGRYDRL